MMRVSYRWWLLATTLILVFSSIVGSAQNVRDSNGKKKINVVLIIADDMNTRMSAFGFPLVKTPNIERLASRGVKFEHAYTQFPWCNPSRASFLTGKRPNTTQVFNLDVIFRENLPDVVTLPQYFKDNGYFSGRVGKVFHQGVPDDIGTSGPDDPISWDAVVNPAGRDKTIDEPGLLINMTPKVQLGEAWAYLDDIGTDSDQTDGKVALEAVKMIEAHNDGPFFIAAGFYRPHVPDVAPKKYFDMYPLSVVDIPQESKEYWDSLLPDSLQTSPENYGLPVDDQKRMARAYYASTTFMDAQAGLILNALERLKLMDHTIVVFMSDHGYLLGEHGQWQKNMLWEPADHVPFVIYVPGAKGNGHTSKKMVELVDLYPTLADMAGLPQPSGNEGRSLRPLLENPANDDWNYPAFSQISGGRSVRTARWRYTEWENGRSGVESL